MKFIDNKRFTIQFTDKEFKLVAKVVAMRFEHQIVNDQMALLLTEKEVAELICLLEIERVDLQYEQGELLEAAQLERLIWAIEKEYDSCY